VFTDASRCTLVVGTNDTVHAEALYLSVNVVEMHDTLQDTRVATVTCRFTDGVHSCSLSTELRHWQHLRNEEVYTNCGGRDTLHAWTPRDSNSVVIDSIQPNGNMCYMDMLEIPLPDSLRSYRLQRIEIEKAPTWSPQIPCGAGYYHTEGWMYLRAVSVRKRP
jgi:hypothetical protein